MHRVMRARPPRRECRSCPVLRAPHGDLRLGEVDRSEDRAHGGSAAGGLEARTEGNISQRFLYQRGNLEQGFAHGS